MAVCSLVLADANDERRPANQDLKALAPGVHGPSVLIEYIVEEGVGGNPANHVHSIIRDLGKPYEEHHERR